MRSSRRPSSCRCRSASTTRCSTSRLLRQAGGGDAAVWLVTFKDHASVAIDRGENAGTHHRLFADRHRPADAGHVGSGAGTHLQLPLSAIHDRRRQWRGDPDPDRQGRPARPDPRRRERPALARLIPTARPKQNSRRYAGGSFGLTCAWKNVIGTGHHGLGARSARCRSLEAMVSLSSANRAEAGTDCDQNGDLRSSGAGRRCATNLHAAAFSSIMTLS